MRDICYVSGTRADFGLMNSTLRKIDQANSLSLSIAVTGMHLLPDYGMTVDEIESQGFTINCCVSVALSGSGGVEMSLALADQITGFTNAWQKQRPDVILLLGDRGEMLAAAIAAVHLNIHIVHIHGGERSGTIDESFRHAISKLSHYHCVATEQSKDRLLSMGEHEANITISGAPGLDEIMSQPLMEKNLFCKKYGIDEYCPFELVLFHPVVQQETNLSQQMEAVLSAVVEKCAQPLVFLPNADSGAKNILEVIRRYESSGLVKTVVHAPRFDYLSLLTHADVLIGNSSSGIIEAASLGTPVVNIGQRQNSRERSDNVVDVEANQPAIAEAIIATKNRSSRDWANVYGDGHAGDRITNWLSQISLSIQVLEKINAY